MRFRKKPVVIEAIQFLGTMESQRKIEQWSGIVNYSGHEDGRCFSIGIQTLEGTMSAYAGDWIIKGVKGEFYPCKPDIFEVTYEAVE